jgi:hypothetical protein
VKINMKKLIALLGAGALVLTMAIPAFAGRGPRQNPNNDNGTVNVANVNNNTVASGYSGLELGNKVEVEKNMVGGKVTVGAGNVVSGSYTGAVDANAVGVVVANVQLGCSECSKGVKSNTANVNNNTSALGDSSMVAGNDVSVESNWVLGGKKSGVEVSAGNSVLGSYTGAVDAHSVGVVVVNAQLSGFSPSSSPSSNL